MPIVDGLSSTKMIRSFEKLNPSRLKSISTATNGRIPIFAVSASLIEEETELYVRAGFDGWILKPIPFPRLLELMQGIVDQSARDRALYRAGGDWERGGWFHSRPRKATEADRKFPEKNIINVEVENKVSDRLGTTNHSPTKSSIVGNAIISGSETVRRSKSAGQKDGKKGREDVEVTGEEFQQREGEEAQLAGAGSQQIP